MSQPPDNYVHGHHESVLRSHSVRTIDNSAAYLIPHLEPGRSLLDVGCGPGTITVEFAQRLAPGNVVGIDAASEVIGKAAALVEETGLDNCTVQTGDTYALDFADNTFDIVHAHQVLQHVRNPVAALREMRRVARPGGVVAVRDADYGGFTWAPPDPMLDRWLDIYHQITASNEVEADAGRYLLGWVQEAGFTEVTMTASTWVYATPEQRQWWGGLWADRARQSTYATEATSLGLADAAGLEAIAEAFRTWSTQVSGVFFIPHGEIIAIA